MRQMCAMKFVVLTAVVIFMLFSCTAGVKKKHKDGRKNVNDTKNNKLEEPITARKTHKTFCCPRMGRYTLKAKSRHSKGRKKKLSKKEGKEPVKKLLHELNMSIEMNSKKGYSKKERNNSKKAMIWPKKMLPALKKMLLNKFNGGDGDNNADNSYLENYDGPPDRHSDDNDNGFSPTSKSDYSDNWDSARPTHHRTQFHGMDVVPLMKMMQENIGDSSQYDSNGFTGTPSNKGNRFLMKMLMSQALGKPDRGAVLKDMMQEFFLANGNDREGEEAREALNELVGHNNLLRMNSDMEGQTASVDMGPTQNLQAFSGPVGNQNMQIPAMRNEASQVGQPQGFGDGVLQAQELPNGQIAPLGNQPALGQRFIGRTSEMMSGPTNPTTRMLNSNMNDGPQAQIPVNDAVAYPVAARIAEMQEGQARRIGAANNDQLVLEEETENTARGIRPPPFVSSRVADNYYDTNQEMKLGPNFHSSLTTSAESQAAILNAVHQRNELIARNKLMDEELEGAEGERYGTKISSFLTSRPSFGDPISLTEQKTAIRRDGLPKKKRLNVKKSPMRSREPPKRHNGKRASKIHKKGP